MELADIDPTVWKDLKEKLDKVEFGPEGNKGAQHLEEAFRKVTAPQYDPDKCDNECRREAVREVAHRVDCEEVLLTSRHLFTPGMVTNATHGDTMSLLRYGLSERNDDFGLIARSRAVPKTIGVAWL